MINYHRLLPGLIWTNLLVSDWLLRKESPGRITIIILVEYEVFFKILKLKNLEGVLYASSIYHL